MHLESVSIQNYKGFLNRQELAFEPGFNLLVGANNSGKTTVLDVIDLQQGLNEPHRSERTIPSYGGTPNGTSSFGVDLALPFDEMRELIGAVQLLLPARSPRTEVGESAESCLALLQSFVMMNGLLKWNLRFENGGTLSRVSGHDVLDGVVDPRLAGNSMYVARIEPSVPAGSEQLTFENLVGAHATITGYINSFRSRIYRFSARRQPGSDCPAALSVILDREATSLPYCINHLQTNDAHGHQLLCAWVNRVFPSVKWVQATPTGGSFQSRARRRTR